MATFVLNVVLATIFNISLSGSLPITTGVLNFSRNCSVAFFAISKPSTKSRGCIPGQGNLTLQYSPLYPHTGCDWDSEKRNLEPGLTNQVRNWARFSGRCAPGAEAAFKLIGEANMVLSDKVKRVSFDIKHKAYMTVAIPKAPPQQRKTNSALILM